MRVGVSGNAGATHRPHRSVSARPVAQRSPTFRSGWGLVGLLLVTATLAGCGSSPGTKLTVPVTGDTSTVGDTTATSSTTTNPSSSTTTTTTIVGEVSAAGTWTVMVYAVGDTNLEAALLTDMKEMRAVTNEVPNLTFVVLADRSDAYSSEELGRLGDWTTTKLVDVSGGRFTEVDDLGEKNLGNPLVLINFLKASASHAPADHYALVFWDHGSGVGIGPDESHDDVLEIREIAAALEEGLQPAGIGTLDMIGFDACLMASLEAASAVYPFASYMIASEELEPWEGWAWGGFGYLATAADPTVEMLGQSLLSAYTEASAPTQASVTMSLLDLRRFPSFYDTLGNLTEIALDNLDSSAAAFGRRRDKVTKFGSDPDPSRDFFMVDLGQLLNRMGRSDTSVAEEAARAADLLAEMVVANATGEASKGARGLSVHFPSAPEWFFPEWYDDVGSPVWGSFLEGYFGAGRAIPPSRQPSFDSAGPATEFVFDDFGITVAAQFDQAAVDTMVSAVLWSGVEDPDGSITFYSSTQGFEGEDAVWGGVYDLSRMVLSDGVDSAFAFTQISFNEDATFFTLTVPLWYRAPIDPSVGRYADPIEVTLTATFNMDTGEGTKGLFSSNGESVGPFAPEPNGLLLPKLAERPLGGEIEWVSSTDVGLRADLETLVVDFEDLPSGTPLHLELTVADFGGNTATATVSTVIP